MPSQAYDSRLLGVLRDAEDVLSGHRKLRTRGRGRQWGLGGLNRAVVVLAVSAWEAYIEGLVLESIEVARPSSGFLGTWDAWSTTSIDLVRRFNTPDPKGVRRLLRCTLGITDVTAAWHWQGCDKARAVAKLGDALGYRHRIAHGADPRPVVHNTYAAWLPGFFERLGRCTDDAVRSRLTSGFGVTTPWP
jgi:hypothetical protein